jgi:hypothetical protein
MFKNDYIDFFNLGQQKLEIYLYENCMPQDDEVYTLDNCRSFCRAKNEVQLFIQRKIHCKLNGL